MAWVIDDAPVPPDLAWTLIVIARRCDDHGRGSYQSMPTLATKTGKSEKQARRDVARLLELGLIRAGDQSLPERNGVPLGRRPTVYDVVLDLQGEKPARQSKNPTGARKGTTTPPTHATPPMQGTPPMHGVPTPPMEVHPTPPMDGSQIKPLKNPKNNPSYLPADVEPEGPSDSNPEEGGGGEFSQSNEPNPHASVVAQLIEPLTDDLAPSEQARLGKHLTVALAAGWHEDDLIKELSTSTAGLKSVAAGLISRIRNLGQPPTRNGARTRKCGTCDGTGEAWIEMFQTMTGCPDCAGAGRMVVEEPKLSDEKCPVHKRAVWHNCYSCWGDVKAGDDPYSGCYDIRPDGWPEIYWAKELREERDRERRKARGEFVPYRDPVDKSVYLQKF